MNAAAIVGFAIFVLLFAILFVAVIRFIRKMKPKRDSDLLERDGS